MPRFKLNADVHLFPKMRILTLASAVGALEYQEAINKLESTQFVKPEEPHRTLVSYFLDYLQSPKMENIQETFDWKQYSKSSSTILEIGDQIEIPPKAEAMVALEECSKTDPRCTKMMADISLHGLYGIRQNATDAFHYYKLLSDAGDAVGHRQIGNLYATGIGTERNYAKALVYMSFAALDGDLLAEQTLGYWNHAGIGMPKSCKNALWHYQRVANHSNYI